MLEPIPFRFLDLPKELRFMVYERLDVTSKQLRLLPTNSGFHLYSQRTHPLENPPMITVFLETLPVQILSTCRLIYSEALPFLSRKLEEIRGTIPRISVNMDCLYTSNIDNTQRLLCAVLDDLNRHPFFQAGSGDTSTPRKDIETRLLCSSEVDQWLKQTTHLLLSQRPAPCPFSGFMGARTYPAVRLVIEVPTVWKYNTWQGLSVESHAQAGATPAYTKSIATQLSEVWNGLVDHTRQLKHVKSRAIVFGQEDERVLTKDGLVIKKTVALDFGICRVIE